MDFNYLKDNALKQVQDWNFGTRINKKDFWSYILVLVVINVVSGIVFGRMAPALANLISLAVSVVTIPVAIRRCHDINKSGWAYGIPMLIITGMVVLMFIMGGAAIMGFAATGGMAAGASLAGLGAAAGLGMLTLLVSIGVLIYLIVIFVKDSYPEENKWGPVPAAAKKVETKTEAKAEPKAEDKK